MTSTVTIYRTLGLLLLAATASAGTDGVDPQATVGAVSIRAGHGHTIIAVRPGIAPTAGVATAGVSYPHPRPRFTGFSPLVAIATSNRHSNEDLNYEHRIEGTYVGSPLFGFAQSNFVVGVLDSGSVADVAAGDSATTLGLFGQYLTTNTIAIGGVGEETVNGFITEPIGVFTAGLSAVNEAGVLDLGKLVGHSNVAAVAAPPIDCGQGESVTALLGNALMAFFTSVIRVDLPRKVTVRGVQYASPDVRVQPSFAAIPDIAHSIALGFGNDVPPTTATYYADFEDLETPIFPTLLNPVPSSIPFGALFFADTLLREGEPSFENLPIPAQLIVDTGAQASIISSAIAANLSLPFEPDFVVDVCGVGGLETNIPGYFIDYMRINALGGPLEFSRIPVIVLDLPSSLGGSPDGILGMNMFWNRNVIFDPFLQGSSFIHVSDPIPFAWADYDQDWDVDQEDLVSFEACFAGQSPLIVPPECDHIDVDFDGAVDLHDWAQFQRCYSGPDVVTNDSQCQ